MADHLTELPWCQLRESPLNPRKFFEADAVAELAASIRDKGVLQNLTARVSPHDPDLYEIISGARRFRAFGLLVEQGGRDPDDELPVRVIGDCDDLEFLRLATAENVARRDMTPLEEAEAFAGLIAAGDRTEDIAALVGKSQRFVQLRIDLVTKLGPEAQDALRAGDISVEQARAIKAAPKDRQAIYITRVRDHGWTAEDVKRDIAGSRIPKSAALFAPQDYTDEGGEWIEDEGEWFFANEKLFTALQRLAIQEKAQDLKAQYPWVKVFEAAKGQALYLSDFPHQPDHPQAGAVIYVTHSHEVKIHEGVVERAALDRAEKAAAKAENGGVTQAHLTACRNAKSVLLQEAVADNEEVAMMLAIIGLLGGSQIAIDPAWHHKEDQVLAPGVDNIFYAWTKRLPELLEFDPSDWRTPLRLKYRHSDKTVEARMWRELQGLSRTDRNALFAALVAARFGSFSYCNVGFGDDPLPAAVAEDLGLKPDPHAIPERVLQTASRDMLTAAIGHLDMLDPKDPEKSAAEWAVKPTNAVRDTITEAAASRMFPGLTLPTLSFGPSATIEAQTADWINAGKVKKPAKAKGKAKPKEAA